MLSHYICRGIGYITERFRSLHGKIQLRDNVWGALCGKIRIPLETVKLTNNASLQVEFKNNVVTFPKCVQAFHVLLAYRRLCEIDSYTNCRMVWDTDSSSLSLSWGEAHYLADNSEEIDILSEIYISGDYDLAFPNPTVLIDIGANVGFASIFLANSNPDIFIEACDPLSVNLEKAARNIKRNSGLHDKITLHQFGLFSEDAQKYISTEDEGRGRSSIVIDRSDSPVGKEEKTLITVRKASAFFNEVKRRHPNRKIIVKMDCEGSEYEILQNLETDGVLKWVDGFMMEWHRIPNKNLDENFIRALFQKNGFVVCVLGRHQTKSSIGMAYAFKNLL